MDVSKDEKMCVTGALTIALALPDIYIWTPDTLEVL